MSEIIRAIESEQLKKDLPKFNVGDTLRVMVKVVEGDRERLQAFEGICIAKRNGSILSARLTSARTCSRTAASSPAFVRAARRAIISPACPAA